jgi:hypothetical protein
LSRNRWQAVDPRGERVVLDIVYVDIGVECETYVLLDPEDVDEFVPKFDLVFFAGWLGWAVGSA